MTVMRWTLLFLMGCAPASMNFPVGNDVDLQIKPLDEARKLFADKAQKMSTIRVTAFQPYVKWMLLEPKRGEWDFTFYDMEVSVLKAHKIKWVPFIIAGPAYATPAWFKDSPESVFAQCLEHGKTTRTQSIWNPHLQARIEELLRRLAEHYDPRDMEAVLVGISGDFGESIYTVDGNYWTFIWDGEYHRHEGYWCGDPYAVADFRSKMKAKYGSIDSLNAAWGTSHSGFEQVAPFLPSQTKSRRAILDLQRWYCRSMTDWTEFWLRACKKALPRTPIFVCTGGDGVSSKGADFSAQSKLAADLGCGMRITNEASRYSNNFAITRWIGSSCRHYGAPFGYEPAGEVNTSPGIAARIYNAVASGAEHLFTYDNFPSDDRAAVYNQYRHLLVRRDPVIDTGLFLSRTSLDLGRNKTFTSSAERLRDLMDFDFVDENLIESGMLRRLKTLVWVTGPIVEKSTADALRAWTEQGGRLILSVKPETVEGETLEFPKALRVDTSGDALTRAAEGTIDGVKDQVYITRTKKEVLIFNANKTEITRDILGKKVTLAPYSIVIR